MPTHLSPWSYTHLDTFETCPRMYHWKYVQKNREEKSKEQMEGSAVHEKLEHFIKGKDALQLSREGVPYAALANSVYNMAHRPGVERHTELKMGITREFNATEFFAKDVWGRGVADVILHNPSKQALWAGDWKTGKTNDKPLQLVIFAALLFRSYPAVLKITAANLWLKTGKPSQPFTFTREQEQQLWLQIMPRLQAMESAAAQDSFPPKPGPLCGWCPDKTCQYNRK